GALVRRLLLRRAARRGGALRALGFGGGARPLLLLDTLHARGERVALRLGVRSTCLVVVHLLGAGALREEDLWVAGARLRSSQRSPTVRAGVFRHVLRYSSRL